MGIFDSGVGGLSVLREIRRLLPAEDLIYFADSAYCPYGSRLPAEIRARAEAISAFLLERGAKLIVVASNTTSGAALESLRQNLPVPVVGMEPAVKPATSVSRAGRVGVLATGVTLASQRFSSLVERYANGTRVYTQPCPGLVDLVEAGREGSAEARELLKSYLAPLLAEGVDTVVLGCTHYPFLRPLVEEIVGPGVKVIDSGAAVARRVARVLEEEGLRRDGGTPGDEEFYTSGTLERVAPVIRRLWGDPAARVAQVSI